MRSRHAVVVAALAASLLAASVAGLVSRSASGSALATGGSAAPSPTCQLGNKAGQIKHVVYTIFDNVHFLRDNPNVPSDVEQMPHLYNFLKDNGTFDTNDHTVLISHTGGGILSSLTGLYPDRHGQGVSNSYGYFRSAPPASVGIPGFSSSFKYWTDLTDDVNATPTDPMPNMVSGDGGVAKNAPAPWVPYTRAGCDFGAVALANTVLENTGTGPAGDMTKVFGTGSPEVAEATISNAEQAKPAATRNFALANLAQTDFVGLAIHCGAGGGICKNNANARPDLLPDEPTGYSGFKGLFGAKYVNPAITGGSAVLNNLFGQPITDQFGQAGFPGFDGLFAATTLSYVAQMQESGVPVTFGYISDAHDQHGVAGEIHATRGPGEADYVAQLKAYDHAFDLFFKRLAADGIDKSNTLIVFTVEEGDHFAGSKPTPADCDGVTIPCTYSLVGEVNDNLQGLMQGVFGITTPFTVHADMAPTVYITGNPARDAAVTRTFGRALGQLTAPNAYKNDPAEHVTAALADPVGMKALHMVTADPQRTPTLVMFAQPDHFLFASSAPCVLPGHTGTPCTTIPTTPPTSTFAWNHGGIQPEIATVWAGMVGPGVRNNSDDDTWTDHTDIRPTMLDLVGLGDTYVHDGRVLIDQLDAKAVPQTLIAHRETLRRLGDVYKQLNAPFGTFGSRT